MDYKAAKRRLFSLINYEKTPLKGPKSLLDFLDLLSIFEHPQDNLSPSSAVRGTKGKGSTSLMLKEILTVNGLSTGLFSSPHLFSPRERITISNNYISKQDFARHTTSIFKQLRERRGIRTYFEVLTLMAIQYFSENRTDRNVFEAGLGGRLDTTRLIDAHFHIITDIGFDHVKILGNTLRDIAFEKISGTDKGIVLTTKQHPKVIKVFKEMEQYRKFKLLSEGHDFYVKRKFYDAYATWITLNSKEFGIIDAKIPLPGRFLIKNFSLSCLAALYMGAKHCNMEDIELPARFQIVRKDPLILVDGSHNPMSILNLRRELNFYFKKVKEKKMLVFAMMQDKNIHDALLFLEDFFDYFVFTEADTPRAQKKENIFYEFKKISSKPAVCMDREKAFEFVLKKSGFTVITGSFFIAGNFLKNLVESKGYPYKNLYRALD